MSGAITRKPKRVEDQSRKPTEAQIQKVITKGGSVPSNAASPSSETMTINIRPPVSLVEQIDQAVSRRVIKTSRHTWLMEAIIEKLQREQ